jgi:fused signal recognition particle receptor
VLGPAVPPLAPDGRRPFVVLVVGVNGSGKTTTIGKLAARFGREGHKVLLAAGDTFRAAAADQLAIWAERAGADIVRHDEGADPGAVVFDALTAAKARGADVVIIDTAGRLQTKKPLMEQLGKVRRVIDKVVPGAPHETLLVVDGTTGQNAVSQAHAFHAATPLTGVVVTKLDGTAKGGVVLAIGAELGLPVRLVGIGEKVEDLRDFDASAFVDALTLEREGT